ncbi:MAG: hypothetical protein ACFFCS_25650 [Candidatus Hodarchaeota archaeon]
MEVKDLYKELMAYFSQHPNLMMHLNAGAIWQYQIFEGPLDDEKLKLEYFLVKKDDDVIEMERGNSPEKPDLILYFTEEAILRLVKDNPDAHEYFIRYYEIMDNSTPEVDLDNKVNKSKIQLFKVGYKKWQSEFKF